MFFLAVSALAILSGSAESDRCGVPPIKPNLTEAANIIGGSYARPGSWPWLVQIWKADPPVFLPGHKYFQCHGTLIGAAWVLAPISCFYAAGSKPSGSLRDVNWDISLVIGATRTDQMDMQWAHVTGIEAFHAHPDYYWTWDDARLSQHVPFLNDIALLKLKTPVSQPFNNFTRTVCLPPKDDAFPSPGLFCAVAGWGNTWKPEEHKHFFNLSPRLKQIAMPILPYSTCSLKRHKDMFLCAGLMSVRPGPCGQDLGTPLVCRARESDPWMVAGLWNDGPDDCYYGPGPSESYTNKFLRVSHYVDWINSVMDA